MRRGQNYDVGLRERRRWMLIYAVVAILVLGQLAGLGLSVVTVLKIRGTQTANAPSVIAAREASASAAQAAETSQKTLDQILDCINDPKSPCYRAAKQRDAVRIQVDGLYIACAAGYADLSDMRRIEATTECAAEWIADHPDMLAPQPRQR